MMLGTLQTPLDLPWETVAYMTCGVALALSPCFAVSGWTHEPYGTGDGPQGLGRRDKRSYCNSIPLHRGADPKEVAKAILFLAPDDASSITGHTLVVDGGLTASTGLPNFPKLTKNEAAP